MEINGFENNVIPETAAAAAVAVFFKHSASVSRFQAKVSVNQQKNRSVLSDFLKLQDASIGCEQDLRNLTETSTTRLIGLLSLLQSFLEELQSL